VVAAAAAWALGLDGGHVVAVGTATASVAVVLGALPLPVPVVWPEAEPQTSGTGWHQVALLSGVLRQTDRDPDRIGGTLTRLRALASARLARHGVALEDPGGRDLLGPELVDVLLGRRPPPPATRLAASLLDRLDALDGPDRGEGAHRTDERTPPG
jgi:hypothetical protein